MEQKILVVPVKAEKKIMGAFHSTLTSSLNFRQKWMEQCFQRFRKQRTTSRGIPKFSKFFFPGRFLSIHFALGISRIFGWMVRIQFPEFLETFPGNSCTIYPSFQVFESFGWMESAQYLEGITFYRKNGKHYTGMNRSVPLASLPESPVAFEFSRFFLLLGAKDVSPGGTSATQRKEFHTDDVKSVRNLVRSSDWST